MEELISVIVPIYNIEDYIDRCVESIVTQTFRNLEIILVDDGSKDRSLEKCKEWEKKDSRIIVITRENGGAASARNTGLSVCKGQYVMFVDGDDLVSSRICEVLHKNIHNSQADIVIARMQKLEKNGEIHVTRDWHYANEREILGRESCLQALLLDQLDCGPCHKLFLAEKARKIGFPEGVINEDLVFLYKYLININRAVLIKDILYTYQYRENSVTSSAFSKKTFDRFFNSLMMRKDIEILVPSLSSESQFYFWRQSLFLLKEMIQNHVVDTYSDMWSRIRKSLKQDFKDILKSKHISIREKISYFLIAFLPSIYIHRHGQ